MLASRQLLNALPPLIRGLRLSIHTRDGQYPRHKSSKQAPQQPPANFTSPATPSLFEELFPDEARQSVQNQPIEKSDTKQHVPRLDFDDLEKSIRQKDDFPNREVRPQEVTEAASKHAFYQENVTVVALRGASKSLAESDFRRIAPKGKHIKDWTGPGEILKGERNMFTLHIRRINNSN